MTEEFLHYLWKYRMLDESALQLDSGEKLQIIKPGEHNTNAGPDFFNARIKIGNTLWAGNVEIHINSSDWHTHKHQNDDAYNNVILHVVYKHDKQVQRKNGQTLPAIELKGKFDESIFQKYSSLKTSVAWIPCEKQIKKTSSFILSSWLERLLINRLERKAADILNVLNLNKNNWEQSFYEILAKSFGFKVNAQPMEQLARATPLRVLLKHRTNLLQLEALLFGQAGMLHKKFSDTYSQQLQKEYQFLKQKFQLTSLPREIWKFLRLRPANFPTIRIAQLAGLIHSSSNFFSKVMEAEKLQQIKKLFNTTTSNYWETHYQFDKVSANRKKQLGEDAINILIINVICPFLFVYGKQKGDELYCERALAFLEEIEAEKNSIVKKWENIGIKSKTAYDSQALLELKNEFCLRKKCLQCAVGNYLLKN